MKFSLARMIHRDIVARTALVCTALAAMIGCSIQPRPIHSQVRPAQVRIAGQVEMMDNGKFSFRLDEHLTCEREVLEIWCKEPSEAVCREREKKTRRERVNRCDKALELLILTPPWGESIRATLTGDRVAIFAVDWDAAEIDPVTADARRQLEQTRWRISTNKWAVPFTWSPHSSDIQTMLQAIARSQGFELPDEVGDGRPAEVAVRSLSVEGGQMFAGEDGRLQLTLVNKGPGVAHGVVARTRSGNGKFHNLQFTFGSLGVGQERTKAVELVLPKSRKNSSAMVVVVVEANNQVASAPVRYNQRIPIHKTRPKPRFPRLTLSCKPEGNAAQSKLTAFPGQELWLWCNVRNQGDASAAGVEVTVQLADKFDTLELKRRIPRNGKAGGRVAVRVPTSAKIGTKARIRAFATAQKVSQPARFSLDVAIVKPSPCPGGPITREQYNKKIAKLKKLRANGTLDQDEFDQYDAELVMCIE